MPPLVSFLIPTCGRASRQPHLLMEAVATCLNQTYPNIEVVVLNDAPDQFLSCSNPKVQIFNGGTRYPDLGTKMNRMVEYAQGEICLVNEDDDVSCSWRATQAVNRLGSGADSYDWWSPLLWCYAEVGKHAQIDGNGTGYTSSAWRRTAMMGNHPAQIVAHDRAAVDWARANLRCNPKSILKEPHKVSYVYRWGVSDFHFSAYGNAEQLWHSYNPGPPGTYVIEPKLLTNWDQIVIAAAMQYKSNSGH